MNSDRSDSEREGSVTWRFPKIPRIAHFYFGHQRISFLRFLSIYSFSKLNPDWEIVFYRPEAQQRKQAVSWTTGEFYEGNVLEQEDYLEELVKLPNVRVKHLIFSRDEEWLSEWPDSFRADYLRWTLLSSEGGLFSDTDILFIRPMSAFPDNGERTADTNTVICVCHRWHRIGAVLSCPNHPFFEEVKARVRSAFNPRSYQSIGPCLMNEMAPTPHDIASNHPSCIVLNLPLTTFYPFDDRTIPFAFEFQSQMHIPASTIGIHWYGGHPISQFYNWKFNEMNFRRFDNLFTRKIAEVFP